MKKLKIFIPAVLILAILMFSCEELQELLTTVSGNVQNQGNPVSNALVIAINASLDAYVALADIESEGIDEGSLSAISNIVKGFDLSTESNGDYTATLISGGSINVISISDENDNDNLDSLDLVGWYGDTDSIKIPDPEGSAPADSITVIYTIPQTVSVDSGDDVTDVDIEHLLEYWKILLVQSYLSK